MLGERIVADLRSQLYEHIHRLSLGFFAERRVGELILLASDVTLVRAALTNNVATVSKSSSSFLSAPALMLVLNWRLTLFILFLAPMVAPPARRFSDCGCAGYPPKFKINLPDSSALAEEAMKRCACGQSLRARTL